MRDAVVGTSAKPPLALALEPRSARWRATVARPTVPLGVEAGGALEALDDPRVAVAELAVGLDLEAGLAERLLQLADVGARRAGAQGAVTEVRRLAAARQAAAAGDTGTRKASTATTETQTNGVRRRHDS